MTKPDIMWLTARQALVFHRGRIWAMSQEDESQAWFVYIGARVRGESVTHFGQRIGSFPGGYHAALECIQKWLPATKAA